MSNETRTIKPASITTEGEQQIFTGTLLVGGVNDVRETKTGLPVVNVGAFAQMSEEQIANGESTRVNLVWFRNLANVHHQNRQPGDRIWVKGKFNNRTYTDKAGVEHTEPQVIVQGFKLLSTRESRAARQSSQSSN